MNIVNSNLNLHIIQLKALILKEYKEAFRDKRALIVALMMAFLAPVAIVLMSKIMIEKLVDEPPVYVKFSGAEYAPKLIMHFADNNLLNFADVPEDEKQRGNSVILLLIFLKIMQLIWLKASQLIYIYKLILMIKQLPLLSEELITQ